MFKAQTGSDLDEDVRSEALAGPIFNTDTESDHPVRGPEEDISKEK